MDRKSRLPVRSNSSEKIVRGKSLSSLRPSQLEKKRSSSVDKYNTPRTFHLKPKSNTCSANRRKSPLANKEKRPTGDPAWQQQQLINITAFIQSIEPKITNFKKPSVNEFIMITNILLTELFEEFALNNQNYKTELPKLLKLLDYPGTISKSILQCPYSSGAFPVLISFWSFLLDLVQHDPSKVFEDRSPMADLRFKYQKMHVDVVNKDGDLKTVFDEFEQALKEFYNIDENELFSLKEKLEREEKEHAKIKSALDLANEEYKEVERKVNERQVEIDTYRKGVSNEQERIISEIKDIQAKRPLLNEKMKKAQEIMQNISSSDQSYSEDDVKGYENEIKSQKLTLELLEKRRDEQLCKIDKIDKDYTSKIEEIKRKVYELNNCYQDASIYFPEAASACVPEEGFLKPSFMQALEDVSQIEKSITKKIAAEIEAKNKSLLKSFDLEREFEKDLVKLEEKDEVIKQSIKELEKKREKLNHNPELEILRKEVQELRAEINNIGMDENDLLKAEKMVQDEQLRLSELEKEKQIVYARSYKEVHEAYDMVTFELYKHSVARSQKKAKLKKELAKITMEMEQLVMENVNKIRQEKKK